MHARTPASPFALVTRAVAASAAVVGILLIGYSTPVETVFASGLAAPQPAATVYGNGPTGYFPDMFTIAEDAAEPAEPAPTF
jgi:hypothetical protein